MANFCNECGEQVDPAAKFCPVCLASIAPTGSPPQAVPPVQSVAVPAPAVAPPAPVLQAQTYTSPPSNNTPWIIGAIVGLLLLLGVGYRVMTMKDSGTAITQPANQTDPAAVGPEMVKYVISDANIRSLATARGSETRVVGAVQRGVQVKGAMYPALGGDGYWFKLADGRGYISAVNLSDAPPVAAAAVAGAAPAVGGTTPVVVAGGTRAPVRGAPFCRVATRTGNLRIRASANGPIIGGMPKGARFQAFNSETDPAGAEWYQVQPFETRYPNGWVSADFIAC
ncbi:MAG: hypothetical protein RL367_1553 [Pseudomonadota bacterium]|jgi:hypothetical protein